MYNIIVDIIKVYKFCKNIESHSNNIVKGEIINWKKKS